MDITHDMLTCNNSLDINLGNTVITNNGAARVCLSIVEFLLFNRNQIPFVYDTLRQMVHKLEKFKIIENRDDTVRNYALDRQRNIAIQTTRKFAEISIVNIILL